MMTLKTVDPITLTVIWNSLISIAEELGITLRHTAFSEGVREGDDFATALFDRDAVMIAQGNFSPGHLGSMPFVAKSVLQYFPVETLKPGDSILVNDSFIGAGHFPDTYQIMPVFLDGRVIGFVACSAHQVDMGGAAPGSQKVHGVTEAFQEGLRILPVRFVREGKIDEDILRIVLGNVRMCRWHAVPFPRLRCAEHHRGAEESLPRPWSLYDICSRNVSPRGPGLFPQGEFRPNGRRLCPGRSWATAL